MHLQQTNIKIKLLKVLLKLIKIGVNLSISFCFERGRLKKKVHWPGFELMTLLFLNHFKKTNIN